MYRGVDTVGYYRVDHVLDPRRKGKGQYFWRKAVVRAFFYYYYYYYFFFFHMLTQHHHYQENTRCSGYNLRSCTPSPKTDPPSLHRKSTSSSFQKRLAQPKKLASRGFKRYKSPLSWDGSRIFSTLPPTSPKSWPKKYITNLISTELLELVVWHF